MEGMLHSLCNQSPTAQWGWREWEVREGRGKDRERNPSQRRLKICAIKPILSNKNSLGGLFSSSGKRDNINELRSPATYTCAYWRVPSCAHAYAFLHMHTHTHRHAYEEASPSVQQLWGGCAPPRLEWNIHSCEHRVWHFLMSMWCEQLLVTSHLTHWCLFMGGWMRETQPFISGILNWTWNYCPLEIRPGP